MPGSAAPLGDAWSDGVNGAARSGRNQAVPERPLTHRSRTDSATAPVDVDLCQVLDSVVATDWNQAPYENGSGGPTSMPSSAAARA